MCGLGKLVACIAATFAARGFPVVGADIDPEKIRRVNAGPPPVEEPRAWPRRSTKTKGRLRATDDPAEALQTNAWEISVYWLPPYLWPLR